MKSIFRSLLLFFFFSGFCYLAVHDFSSPDNSVLPHQNLVIKACQQHGSSANINEVEVLVNIPVIKKIFFTVSNSPLNVQLKVFRSIELNFSSLLYSSQLLFLSHSLLRL